VDGGPTQAPARRMPQTILVVWTTGMICSVFTIFICLTPFRLSLD
jgi:hypothetical protein